MKKLLLLFAVLSAFSSGFAQEAAESRFNLWRSGETFSLSPVTDGVLFGTGVLLSGGNHFLTDVLAGAALGSAVGFLVPWLHTFNAKHRANVALNS